MSRKPLRPCRHPGCCVLVPDGYCAAHKPKYQRSTDSAAWHRLYATPEWTDDLRPDMGSIPLTACAASADRVFSGGYVQH